MVPPVVVEEVKYIDEPECDDDPFLPDCRMAQDESKEQISIYRTRVACWRLATTHFGSVI